MAVKISNGCKRYAGRGNFVLNRLNMDVRRGEIYGLLGSSGCGKTILLSCIVGLKKLDDGDVVVFNQRREGSLGNLCGWMPQDLSLMNALSIGEVLRYFGMIYGMTLSEIENEIRFLSAFLDLPPTNRSIRELSGGQKRRVSLAVAVIHKPGLLVLDEPSVGLDPLLRQRIWEHLFDISRLNDTTIIISTHYLEETKRCDKIGFMRGGKLLVEDSPQSLLNKFGFETLEEVALELCRNDESSERMKNYSDFKSCEDKKAYNLVTTGIQSNQGIVSTAERNHASILGALGMKWWLRRKRDWRFIAIEFCIPIMAIVLFQIIVGPTPKGVNVAVVMPDYDVNIDLEQYCNFNEKTEVKCLENVGICDFIGQFDNGEFNWIPINSYTHALQSIQLGNTIALLEFRDDFSNHTRNRILHRNFANNETIAGSTISVRMDESSPITASWLKKTLVEKYVAFIESIGKGCSLNGSEIVRPPLKFHAVYGNTDIYRIILYMQPGIFILLLFMLSNAGAIVTSEDRRFGLEDRDYVAGVTLGHRLLADVVTQSIISWAQLVVFFSLFHLIYGMEVRGMFEIAVGLAYLTAIVGLTIGWMISSLRDDMLETVLIVLFVTVTQSFSSGALFSLEMATPVYQVLSQFLPTTHIVDSFRSICTRGWGLEHPHVTKGFLSGTGWILVSVAVCVLSERRRYK